MFANEKVMKKKVVDFRKTFLPEERFQKYFNEDPCDTSKLAIKKTLELAEVLVNMGNENLYKELDLSQDVGLDIKVFVDKKARIDFNLVEKTISVYYNKTTNNFYVEVDLEINNVLYPVVVDIYNFAELLGTLHDLVTMITENEEVA